MMGTPSYFRATVIRWTAAIVLALSPLLMAPQAIAEPKIAAPTGARNVTADWQLFMRDGELDAKRVDAAYATVLDELRGYKIVVVPSFLSGLLIEADEAQLTEYIRAQVEALKTDGIDIEIAPIDTEQSVAENGRQLATYLAGNTRPVCIISHSKGGLDTLEYLLRAAPEYRRQIACWVVMQSPFAGSPVADLIVGEKWMRGITDPLLRVLGGSEQSLDDLTVSVRKEYMKKNFQFVELIGNSLPIIVVATYVDGSRTPSLHMAPTQRWMKKQGLENDGLVPIESALLPGARYIVVPGLDHTDTVAKKAILGNPIDRVLLWKSLLYMALSDRPT